jgi:hypothetical protein
VRTKLLAAMTLAGCVLLGGCAGSPMARQREALEHFNQSSAEYRNCLTANESNPSACEGKRLIKEADEKTLNGISSVYHVDITGAVNVSSQRRC